MDRKLIYNETTDSYHSADFDMKREEGLTPNGNEIDGRWVLRDKQGNWIDVDKYRHDIAPRHNMELA